MKFNLLKSSVVIALALQPLHSYAHDSVIAHVHEWPVLESLTVIGIASLAIFILRRTLKR